MPRIKVPPSEPETIGLYYTVPLDSLSDADVQRMRTDFALAAHEQYQPMVRMVVSQRTDFVGRTAEQVLEVLEREGRANAPSQAAFMLVTQDTVLSAHAPGQEIEVVYVERWARLDDFLDEDEDGDGLVAHARARRAEGSPDLAFALKLRIVLF